MPNLHVIDAESADPSVIVRLEEALEKARAGRVSSIAIAMVYRDGSSCTSWSNMPSFAALLGAVTHLQWRISRKMEE